MFVLGGQCREGRVPSALLLAAGDGQEITSPNYPEDNYDNGHDCYWHIQAPDGMTIRAEILDLGVRLS